MASDHSLPLYVLVSSIVVVKQLIPAVSPPQAPPKQTAPTWSGREQLGTISADVQYTTAAYKNQQQQMVSVKEELTASSEIPQYGASLHSDKILATTNRRSSAGVKPTTVIN